MLPVHCESPLWLDHTDGPEVSLDRRCRCKRGKAGVVDEERSIGVDGGVGESSMGGYEVSRNTQMLQRCDNRAHGGDDQAVY
jgi:hypothetical protein